MLVHKGGKIKNWGGECRDVTPTKLQSQNVFKESTGCRIWGVRMEINEELKFFGGSGRGGRVGGVRVNVNREVKFL